VPTITLSRQLGSLGDEVAQAVAAQLGYTVVGRELINQAARQAGAPEMALAVIDELGLLGVSPSAQAQAAYDDAMRQVMADLADVGRSVIVGRAGCVLLAGHPAALHVRVVAPVGVRVARLAAAGLAPAAAQAQIEASDRTRALFVRRHYGVDWDATDLYDLVVNTGRLTVEAAAALVCLALARRTQPAAPTGAAGEGGTV
jgi:cytidylate kinase